MGQCTGTEEPQGRLVACPLLHSCMDNWHQAFLYLRHVLLFLNFIHSKMTIYFLWQVPVWRDHSTSAQCARLAQALNGNDVSL
jgi:hypothetical protein